MFISLKVREYRCVLFPKFVSPVDMPPIVCLMTVGGAGQRPCDRGTERERSGHATLSKQVS